MLQLTIKTDLDALPAAIEANFPEIRKELDALLSRYEGLLVEVTDKGSVAAAKKDCADLQRLATMLEEARKRVKAKCLKPYADFEARIKELTARIAEVRGPIDAQIKAADKARREQVAAALSDYYAAQYASTAALVPFERIFDPRWTNVTVSENTAHDAIAAKAQEIMNALGAISDTAPEGLLKEAASRYTETLDLAGTLSWLRERKERDAALAAATARPKPQNAVSTDSGAASDGGASVAEPSAEPTADAPESASPATDDDHEMTYTLRFTGRRSALFALAAWMRDHGISYVKL